MMDNMAKFIFIIAVIAHLSGVNGVSKSLESSTPSLTVIPSSNSIQVSWEKLSSWSSASVYMVSLRFPESVTTLEFFCNGGPGTKCVFDTEDFTKLLPSCTPVAVTVEASRVVTGPHITTTLSPDPLKLTVDANNRNLYIRWKLPNSCEKSSKLIIRSQDGIVHEKSLSLPKSSYTYELSDNVYTSDVLEVLVKTVNSEGEESKGLKKIVSAAEFLGPRYHSENPSLALTPHNTSVDVIFLRLHPWETVTNFTLAIHQGTDNTGDELCSSSFTCDINPCIIESDNFCDELPTCTDIFVEVFANGDPDDATSESTTTICNNRTTTTASTTVKTTTVSTTAKSTTPSAGPDLTLTPHMTFVDIIFFKAYPWTGVNNFTLTIHKGTDSNGDELCSPSPFICSKGYCNINSGDYCDSLPDCTDVFVGVLGNGALSSESTTTLCGTTSTTTTVTTTLTSTSASSTPSTTATATTSTVVTTSPTTSASTTITTTSTTPTTTPSTTTTPEPGDPSVKVITTSDSVTVTWYRNGPWSGIYTFSITITDENLDINSQTDIASDLCSANNVTCTEQKCSFDSKAGCPEAKFTSCSEVSVTVSGDGSSQPAVPAQIAPLGPSELTVKLNGTVVDLQWVLPATCETGSRVNVNVADHDEANEVIPSPDHTYRYIYPSDLACDVGQAMVKAIGNDGESEGTSVQFLLTEIKSLEAFINSESTILVTWIKEGCVKKTKITWYADSESEENLIGTYEVNGGISFTIEDVGNYEVVLVCVIPKAHAEGGGWAEGEKHCTIASDQPPTTTEATTTTITTTTTPAKSSVTSNTDDTDSTTAETGTTDSGITDSDGPSPPPDKDNTALIVGLSVGIPVGLIAIAVVAYIIKKKVIGEEESFELT